MARQLLKNLIGDVNRLLTAGAASVHGHEKMRGYRSQIEALSARIPALAPLGELIAEVVAADAPQAAISLLNLATRTRAIAAAICEAEPINGELTALPFATEFTSDTPVCEVVAQTQRFDNSRQYRQDVGRGHQPLPPMDLRFVGKLMGILKDRYYADTVVEEILPKADRSFARAAPRSDRPDVPRRLPSVDRREPSGRAGGAESGPRSRPGVAEVF